jgi:hypothetical protein
MPPGYSLGGTNLYSERDVWMDEPSASLLQHAVVASTWRGTSNNQATGLHNNPEASLGRPCHDTKTQFYFALNGFHSACQNAVGRSFGSWESSPSSGQVIMEARGLQSRCNPHLAAPNLSRAEGIRKNDVLSGLNVVRERVDIQITQSREITTS